MQRNNLIERFGVNGARAQTLNLIGLRHRDPNSQRNSSGWRLEPQRTASEVFNTNVPTRMHRDVPLTDVLHVREHRRLGRHQQQLGSSRTCGDDSQRTDCEQVRRTLVPYATCSLLTLPSATALRLSAVQQLTILLRDAASQPLGELLERGHDAVAVAAAEGQRVMKWRIRWKNN